MKSYIIIYSMLMFGVLQSGCSSVVKTVSSDNANFISSRSPASSSEEEREKKIEEQYDYLGRICKDLSINPIEERYSGSSGSISCPDSRSYRDLNKSCLKGASLTFQYPFDLSKDVVFVGNDINEPVIFANYGQATRYSSAYGANFISYHSDNPNGRMSEHSSASCWIDYVGSNGIIPKGATIGIDSIYIDSFNHYVMKLKSNSYQWKFIVCEGYTYNRPANRAPRQLVSRNLNSDDVAKLINSERSIYHRVFSLENHSCQ